MAKTCLERRPIPPLFASEVHSTVGRLKPAQNGKFAPKESSNHPQLKLQWLTNSECRLPDNFAFARCLQHPQTVAYGLLRLPVALPLVVELQPRPFIRIHGLEVGSPELAIGR
jgi:hypothetical protein